MRRFFQNFGYVQFVATLALVALGTVAIWSAGNARAEVVFHGMWRQNLETAALGLGLYLVLAAVDYRSVLRYLATGAYALALVLLVAVLVFGSMRFGGRRWLWFFQPSELSKLCVIMFLAHLLPRLRGFGGFLKAAAAVLVPVALILLEPDLGTALTLSAAVLTMLLASGLWRRGFLVLLAVLATLAVALLGAVYEAERPGTAPERRERILRYVPLKSHQLKRVRVFLFPEEDPTGAGYNLRQAQISIGSGGFVGKGLGQAESNHLKYLPKAISMNDFIFCVFAEEQGFRGSLVLLTLLAAVVFPGVWTALKAAEPSGRLLALGVATLVFAHTWINLAMSLGLVPITGLPLPFVSAGRTFLLTVLLALGLVQSVATHPENPTGISRN